MEEDLGWLCVLALIVFGQPGLGVLLAFFLLCS